jgi:hypothetical protein
MIDPIILPRPYFDTKDYNIDNQRYYNPGGVEAYHSHVSFLPVVKSSTQILHIAHLHV